MKKLVFTALLAGCTGSSSSSKLPSAAFTPHLESQETSVACGADIAHNGNPSWDLRYAYNYDSAGFLVAGTGTWASDPTKIDTFAYTYANNDFESYVYTSGWDGSQETADAQYDAANNLVGYTWGYSDGANSDSRSYAYSNFIGANQPTREEILDASDPTLGYTLAYDADNRLVSATPDSGPQFPWTWTYDEAALPVPADAGNGAIH